MREMIYLFTRINGVKRHKYENPEVSASIESAFVEDEIQRERDRQYAERVMDRVRSARLANNFMSLASGAVH